MRGHAVVGRVTNVVPDVDVKVGTVVQLVIHTEEVVGVVGAVLAGVVGAVLACRRRRRRGARCRRGRRRG